MKSYDLSSPTTWATVESSNFDEPTAEYEAELVSQMLGGDKRAFDEFYGLYVPRLYRFIYYATGNNQHDAEDITQESMLAAIRSLKRFKGGSKLYTWLYAIAQHKVHDHYRRTSRSKAIFSGNSSDDLEFTALPDVSPAIEAQVVDRDMLVEALTSLPIHYRTVLIGKYVEGFSVLELSKSMDRSQKSVESLLTRARAALRKSLRESSEPN